MLQPLHYSDSLFIFYAAMVAKMDELGFGNCTNTGACSAECPKNIKLYNIGRMNRQFIAAKCKD